VEKPHAGHETFTSDVAEREYELALPRHHTDEIAREMTDRKDLAGERIRTKAKTTRAAKSSLNLSGFVEGATQIIELVP
jgi:hypothetical protein